MMACELLLSVGVYHPFCPLKMRSWEKLNPDLIVSVRCYWGVGPTFKIQPNLKQPPLIAKV
jgi:hypothetical protein